MTNSVPSTMCLAGITVSYDQRRLLSSAEVGTRSWSLGITTRWTSSPSRVKVAMTSGS